MYRGNHYLIISKDSLHRDKVLELNQKYGIKTIEYDSSDSSHLIEIRKILEEITQEPVEVMPNTKVQSGVQFEELELTGTHEANLFYKKLEIANVDPELRELSTLFYIAAEKFIRESMRLGFPKEYIDETLVEVFLRYREKYTVLYTLQKKDSNELLIAIHDDLRNINIDRYKSSGNFKPMASETQGMIHVLAEDAEKDVWWGSERLE